MIPPRAADVSSFWNWFSEVSSVLSADFENAAILRELDRRVLALDPHLSWELGPSPTGGGQLVISPSLDKALLPTTVSIIEKAPKLRGWHFLAARPPKEWDFRFSVQDKRARSIQIDGRDWSYVLLRYPDGLLDVILRRSPLPSADSEINWHAASLLVEGALGEMAVIEHINEVDVVESFERDHEPKARPLIGLREDFRRLLNS